MSEISVDVSNVETQEVTVDVKGVRGDPGYTPQKGIDYFDGADGVSPTVSVSEISRGHRVTITDGTGDHTFDVFDGGVAITVDSSGIMHFDEEGN